MKDWYFCVTPDFGNKNGKFTGNQFWYDATNGVVHPGGPGNPPALSENNNDKVSFAVEVTQTNGVDDYSVDDITLVSTICQNPAGAGAVSATVGAPFRNGNHHIVCHFSGAPNHKPEQVNNGKYKRTTLRQVTADPSSQLSAYEIVLVSTVTDSTTGNSYEFSTDPEMDVSN